MCDLLHLERLGEHARGGLLAEDILTGAHEVYRYDRMQVVVGTDRNRIELWVVEYLMIIIDGLSAAVFLHGSIRPLGDDIAEILYLRLFVLHIGGDMCGIGYRSAADYCYLDFF